MAERTGKVWLVGAGPSDAGLMTLRGRELLQSADTVVYDRLLGCGILAMIPPGARKIDVGKGPNRHPVPQEEINRILVKEALAGRRVVRLKGGDPFLFGRGGEEMEALRENKIPCEVVPGVTSAVAVPAYAGIPVTHRGLSSSLHIFTGHPSLAGEHSLDYPALARLEGTLVFLMGVASAERICGGLLRAGKPGNTPVAVVERGTTARQRSFSATLESLPAVISKRCVTSPAVIVIGATAALADRFAWASSMPLSGKRIVVTRPRGRCGEFCRKIRELGGEALAFPCIETVPRPGAFREAVGNPGRFAWIAFSSATGADLFFGALNAAGKDARALAGIRVAAVGSATAKRLAEHGVRPDLVPRKFDGRHLGEALTQRVKPGEKVLVVRARNGSRSLEEKLEESGIPFDAVTAYETRPAQREEVPEIRQIVESGEFDWVAFASSSAVRGFSEAFAGGDYSGVTAVCIGPETAATAEKLGMKTVVSPVSTMDGMLEIMKNL